MSSNPMALLLLSSCPAAGHGVIDHQPDNRPDDGDDHAVEIEAGSSPRRHPEIGVGVRRTLASSPAGIPQYAVACSSAALISSIEQQIAGTVVALNGDPNIEIDRHPTVRAVRLAAVLPDPLNWSPLRPTRRVLARSAGINSDMPAVSPHCARPPG
jgi:hypothetical protein